MNKKIVLSGVNMVEGGILTVYRNVIKSLSRHDDLDIICLVHDKNLFLAYKKENVKFIEYKNIKNSWLKRLLFEYIISWFICFKIKPQVWFSLHDITAFIPKTTQLVYCHNPSPFYKSNYSEWKLDKKFFLFTLFYKWLYKINIKSNKSVIVQQNWIANSFHKWFGIDNVVIAKPNVVATLDGHTKNIPLENKYKKEIIFFYPAVPRVFKNFDVILDALKILKVENNEIYSKIKIKLTFDKGFNLCGDYFIDKCKKEKIESIEFIGFQDQAKVADIYTNEADCLLFPSKLETWGLPLSEAKFYGLPILASDLQFSHETVGSYDKVKFFDPEKANDLAIDIVSFTLDRLIYDKNYFYDENKWPTYNSWNDLADYVVSLAK
ncbi:MULTISPECIES: glycosyltransferase [Pectobacterium]|uniref:glycosyltransferase n=1 Tax=Pectobacterium TaxID=122277 RepID=UPI00188764D3|nr:glycosyltransferase [Pectobacterium carotovorum]